MRRLAITIVLLITFLSPMMIPIPAYAESEKVSLHIEGMV